MRGWLSCGILFVAISAHATVSCFANTKAAGNGVTSSAINTTGASLLVAVTIGYQQTPTVTDSSNNKWQKASLYGAIGGTPGIAINFVPAPTTSASHTFTITNVAGFGFFPSAIFYACSGTATVYPLASQNGLNAAGASVFQPGSVTPIEAGDLIVTGTGSNGSAITSAAIDSGFSTPVTNTASSNEESAAAFLVTTTGSAMNPTWTMSNNTDWTSTIAVFKSAAATLPALNGPQITTYCGTNIQGYSGDAGTCAAAQLNFPTGIAFSSAGVMCFADNQNNVIRCFNPTSTTQTIATVSIPTNQIKTVFGTGTKGFSGDGGACLSALMAHPAYIAFDGSDNLYVADQQNNRIRECSSVGTATTVVGSGASGDLQCSTGQGFGGDGGAATSALMFCPQAVIVYNNFLIVSDTNNNRVRAVNTTGGTLSIFNVSVCAGCIQTILGNGSGSYTGDGGQGINAGIFWPLGLTIDGSGNLLVAVYFNQAIRKVTSGGVTSTFAGNGTAGYTGDGGAATSAELHSPFDVKIYNGNTCIADAQNNAVRCVNGNGNISTLAGNFSVFGTGGGYVGDLGPASQAGLNFPAGLAFNGAGHLEVGDLVNNVIRDISLSQCGGSQQCVVGGTTLSGGVTMK